MKEVKYWEAEDGTKFNSYFDCRQYENITGLQKFQNEFMFFDADCKPTELSVMDINNTEYIVVKTVECAEMLEEWFDDEGLTNPFEDLRDEERVGTFRWNDDENEWRRIEDELVELDKQLNHLNSLMIKLHS